MNADIQLSNDILGSNLFLYCGNNPVSRLDDNGQGWWIAASALVGAIAGTAVRVVSNVSTGRKWNEGIIGAAVGGAMYGVILTTTGSVVAAGFASAAAESLVNQVVSYIPVISSANGEIATKELTKENIVNSVMHITCDTVINGTISAITGKVASKIVPVNQGWFKPKKFTSCFVGNYAVKAHTQTVSQSIFNLATDEITYSINQRVKQGQSPFVILFPNH